MDLCGYTMRNMNKSILPYSGNVWMWESSGKFGELSVICQTLTSQILAYSNGQNLPIHQTFLPTSLIRQFTKH